MAISGAKSGTTVYALRQGGSGEPSRPWFVSLFADALKCRRWCYGATDGITSSNRLRPLTPDRSNERLACAALCETLTPGPESGQLYAHLPNSGGDRSRDASRKRRAALWASSRLACRRTAGRRLVSLDPLVAAMDRFAARTRELETSGDLGVVVEEAADTNQLGAFDGLVRFGAEETEP
jgi:hypothetical protein